MSANDAAAIDELKLAWRALERRLERQSELELAGLRRSRLLDVRRALRPLLAGQLTQALLGALLIVWFALFWTAHRDEPLLLALGAVGQLWAAVLTALAIWEMAAVSRIDYAAPVLAIQKRIAELRRRRTRVQPFLVASGCAMWLPVTLVVFASIGGAQYWGEEVPGLVAWFVWAQRPEVVGWLLANVLAVPLAAFLALRWLRDPRRARLAERVDGELAGRSLLRAEALLDEIAAFERE